MLSQTVSISEVLAEKRAIGAEVVVQGWVRTRRDSKAGISFIAITDGSCFHPLQIIAPNTLPNYESTVLHLTAGCAVRVAGTLSASPAKGQAVELQATDIALIGDVEDPETYPISPKHHTVEYLREYAHLRARTNLIGAVTRVRASLSYATHRFFHEHGFYWLPTPIITTSDCEGAGQMFRVTTLDLARLPKTPEGQIDYAQDYFGKESFLTVSGQLNAESYAMGLSKVYTFGPTFRAENSNTSRHLSEFWMIEPEMAFADLNQIAALAEELLKFIFKVVLQERADDLTFFEKQVDAKCIERLDHFIHEPFAHLDYTEAVEILLKAKKKFEFPVHWGADLQSEHERYLAEEYVGRPVVVKNYPKEIKAFYMRMNDDGKTVAAMDVLAPGMGEIIGGSQREERLAVLEKRIVELGLDLKSYEWYLDLRRYGSVPHAGFGIGFERLMGYITGVANIRDLIPFPRTPKNARF